MQTAAQAAAPSLSKISNPLDGIEQTVRQQAAGQDPQAAKDAAVAAVKALLTGDPAQKQQAKRRAADALAKAQGISPDQAKTQIQDYEKQYEQAVATAKQKAEAAAVTAKSAATQGASTRPSRWSSVRWRPSWAVASAPRSRRRSSPPTTRGASEPRPRPPPRGGGRNRPAHPAFLTQQECKR